MTWQLAFVSVHPKLIEAYRQFGVFRAAEQGSYASVLPVDLRDFAVDQHATVDGSPYGGGDGMVMRADCLQGAIEGVVALWKTKPAIVYTSPSGRPWTQNEAREFSLHQTPTIFICGRFAGVDQRFIDQSVTHEFSVGDYVLAGGELPSLMMAESSLRLIPGVLGNQQSADFDSFGPGLSGLLESPSYTRPQTWQSSEVPKVLLSGNHEDIKKWRHRESLERTKRLRPDLFNKFTDQSNQKE
jgi:tRNA (guanine37-N1)-methyltransferase